MDINCGVAKKTTIYIKNNVAINISFFSGMKFRWQTSILGVVPLYFVLDFRSKGDLNSLKCGVSGLFKKTKLIN